MAVLRSLSRIILSGFLAFFLAALPGFIVPVIDDIEGYFQSVSRSISSFRDSPALI